MTNVMEALVRENADLQAGMASMEEHVRDLALRLDTIGWVPAEGWQESGLGLEHLKATSAMLQDMVSTSPLIKRASELRYGYVFGRGMTYKGLKPRHQEVMDSPYNADAVFNSTAWEELMKARLTDGNIFILYRGKDKQYLRVPLAEITNAMTDPDDSSRVWFIQRTWNSFDGVNGGSSQKVVWYPTSKYTGPRRTSIANKPVDNSLTMHFTPYNRQTGWTFGVPDAYAAITWVMAYSEYLKNNSKLVKAYAQIAYKYSTTSGKKAGADAAAQITMPGSTGGVAAMGPNSDLVPMPRAGSDVSFENGRPLASMVAASLGVSVVALLSDPGAAGSSYGSAQTLDAPTIITMMNIQSSWRIFYKDILKHLKSETVEVEFPSIENDQVYRQIQSLQAAYLTGAISQAEYRAGVIDLMDVVPLSDDLPVPDNFNQAHLTPQEIADNAAAAAELSAQATVQAGSDQGETNNDNRGDTQSTGDNG